MGLGKFAIVAVLVLAVGFTARIAYEQTTEPAYAQDDSPPTGLDCDDYNSQAEAQAALRADPSDPNVLDEDEGPDDGIACETTAYDDPTRDEIPVAAAVGGRSSRSTPPTQSTPPRQRKNDDLLKSGGPSNGPLPLMPDGSCPTEYPSKQDGACYP